MEGEWTVEAMKTLWDLRGWNPFGNAETFGVWKLNTLSFNAIFWVFDNSYVKKRVLCFCTFAFFRGYPRKKSRKLETNQEEESERASKKTNE